MICTSTTSYRRSKWVVPPTPAHLDPATQSLAQALGLSPLIAQLLLNRGISDPAAAADFLDPQFRNLLSPDLLPDIDRAASRIAQAVERKEKITLYGDYDVDGITGTAMLWHTLKAAPGGSANVEYYIPHRVDEGYGLNAAAVDRLVDEGTRLLISVDCGCSAVEPIARAKARGAEVIVCDHHEFGPTLPPACAIVHPRHPASGGAYPNPDLCGAGVAFKLSWAVAQKLCKAQRVSAAYRDLLVEFAALVGLGTVADVVPLVGENRILVKYGLAQLPRTAFQGLRALIDAAGYSTSTNDHERKIDCLAIGFGLAPRLNAAGRMGHAREAVELLTTASGPRAAEIAGMLESQNRNRQSTEKRMADIAFREVHDRQSATGVLDPILIAAHESFHAGVVGIVASRLVETYHRPAFVLAKTHTDGIAECHGSARSISGFELHLAIEHVRDLLTSGGGHAMAGGVRFPLAHLDAFRDRLNAYALAHLTEEQLTAVLQVDAILDLADCNLHTIALIDKLEPFGRGNPRPRFLVPNVRLAAPPRRVGATGAHLQLTVARHPHVQRCIAFKMGPLEAQLPVGTELNLIVEPRIKIWQGRRRVDLEVIALARCDDEPLAL